MLYECAIATSDQEGFLLGSRVKRTTSSVNDSSDETVEKCEDFTIIQGYHVLSRTLARPYNNLGQFDSDLLASHVDKLDQNSIVGYFRFRRQTWQMPSQRERAMMPNLTKLLPSCTLFTLFTSALASEDGDTHSYSCSTWQLPSTNNDMPIYNMTKVPIEIVNMMENTQQYKSFISNSGPSLYSNRSDWRLSQLIDTKVVAMQYEAVYKESLDRLQVATKKLLDSEQQLAALRREVELAEELQEEDDDDLMESIVFTPSLQAPTGAQSPTGLLSPSGPLSQSNFQPSSSVQYERNSEQYDRSNAGIGDMIDLLS